MLEITKIDLQKSELYPSSPFCTPFYLLLLVLLLLLLFYAIFIELERSGAGKTSY